MEMNNSLVQKKISVIIPVYKVERYIRTCLESVIGQSYRNLEIILVDDGSPDSCPAICDEYAAVDPRIKVIHKLNGGMADARNAGLEISSGELLFFVDSDDYINKYCLEMLVNEMEATGADIVECHSNNFLDGNDPDWKSKYTIRKRKILTPNDWLTETNLGGLISCVVWNKLYKADLYDDVRFPVGRIFEDEATTYKVIYKAKKICRVESKLYFYRKRVGSIMTGAMTLKKVEHRVLAFQERSDFFAAKGDLIFEKFSRARLCLAAISVMESAKELDPSGNMESKLLDLIKDNYQAIKNVRSVPFKYRLYIGYYCRKMR